MANYGTSKGSFKSVEHDFKARSVIHSYAPLIKQIKSKGFDPAPDTMPASLDALRKLADAFDSDRRSVQECLDERKKEIQQIHDQDVAEIDARKKQAIVDAIDTFKREGTRSQEELRRIGKRRETLEDKKKAARERFDEQGWWARRHGGAKETLDKEISAINRQLNALGRSELDIKADLPESKEMRDKAKDKASTDAATDRAKTDRNADAARSECKRSHDKALSLLNKNCREFVAEILPKDAYNSALERTKKLIPQPRTYSMPKMDGYKEPPMIVLGWLMGERRRNGSRGDDLVYQRVKDVCPSALCQDAAGSESIRMPLVRRLASGFQVTIEPEGGDANWVGQLIRALTIRLLMSYPPMALNVTLIDPLKNGKTFSGLRRIVDLAHENILPEIVVDSPGISRALSNMRNVMTQHISQYRDPLKDGFFPREAVQAIVVNDFPYAFDKASLSNLARIMETGGTLGTVVVLASNPAYSRSGKLSSSSDYRQIMGGEKSWHLKGGRDRLKREGQALYVQFRGVQETIRHENVILDRLSNGILNARGRVVGFAEMYDDVSDDASWRQGSSLEGVRIPIGMAGGRKRAYLSLGFSGTTGSHHGLIAGTTGAGKSSFMHTMIMSTLLEYPAEEVQLVLIDFKEGVEFIKYIGCDIPAFRSITVTTEPELALAALSDVEREWDNRATKLGMADYKTWREANPNAFAPRIIVLFDEIQELTASNVPKEIRERCLEIIKHMTEQGRSCGIHIFLGSQSFSNQQEIMALANNMKTRVAVEAGSGILADDSPLIHAQDGKAVINEKGGTAQQGNQLVQVAYVDDQTRSNLLEKLVGVYDDPRYRAALGAPPERVFFSHIESNPRDHYNIFLNGGSIRKYDGDAPTIALGQQLSESWVKDAYESAGDSMRIKLANNLLMVGRDFSTAEAAISGIALSLSMDDISRRAQGLSAANQVAFCNFMPGRQKPSDPHVADRADMTVNDLEELSCVRSVVTRGSSMPGDPDSPFATLVDGLHDTMEQRKKYGYDGRGCHILILYGLENARDVLAVDSQQLGGRVLTIVDKLVDIMKEGPKVGIQSVVWTQQLPTVATVFKNKIDLSDFGTRLAFGLSGDDFNTITNDSTSSLTNGTVVLYDGIEGRRYCVRPSHPASKGWLKRFAKRCDEERSARDRQDPVPW